VNVSGRDAAIVRDGALDNLPQECWEREDLAACGGPVHRAQRREKSGANLNLNRGTDVRIVHLSCRDLRDLPQRNPSQQPTGILESETSATDDFGNSLAVIIGRNDRHDSSAARCRN
jgi:hypothetical protein